MSSMHPHSFSYARRVAEVDALLSLLNLCSSAKFRFVRSESQQVMMSELLPLPLNQVVQSTDIGVVIWVLCIVNLVADNVANTRPCRPACQCHTVAPTEQRSSRDVVVEESAEWRA